MIRNTVLFAQHNKSTQNVFNTGRNFLVNGHKIEGKNLKEEICN